MGHNISKKQKEAKFKRAPQHAGEQARRQASTDDARMHAHTHAQKLARTDASTVAKPQEQLHT